MSCFSADFATAQGLPSLDSLAGKALFEKTWVSAPASTAASDGLGPFFNARSCSTCHPRGGRGDLADSLIIVTDDPVYGEFLQTRAVQGLRAEAQVRLVTRDHIKLFEDGTEVVMHQPAYELDDMQYGELHKPVSARIAPSLAGLHLLEQVPVEYLESIADPDDINGDGISGRISEVPEVATGKLMTGRFGWKAESYSLTMQIAKALSLDMGLGNSIFPSAFGDCTQDQANCLQMAAGNSPSSTDPEVSDTILGLLLTYLQGLAPAHQQG
ncbi:MAG: di-heme oxidoredictase family protein, partial [Pseudomonadota bacterium]